MRRMYHADLGILTEADWDKAVEEEMEMIADTTAKHLFYDYLLPQSGYQSVCQAYIETFPDLCLSCGDRYEREGEMEDYLCQLCSRFEGDGLDNIEL